MKFMLAMKIESVHPRNGRMNGKEKERNEDWSVCMQDLYGDRWEKSRLDQSCGSEWRAVTENYRRARRWTRSAEIRRFSWSIDRVDRAGGHIKPLRASILDSALPRSCRWIRPIEESPSLFLFLGLSFSFFLFFPVGGTGWVAGLSGLALRGSARETLQVA